MPSGGGLVAIGRILLGANPLQPELFEFSVDDDSDSNPVVMQLHEAEKKGDRVTLHYRRDLHALFRCSPSEYFVTRSRNGLGSVLLAALASRTTLSALALSLTTISLTWT